MKKIEKSLVRVYLLLCNMIFQTGWKVFLCDVADIIFWNKMDFTDVILYTTKKKYRKGKTNNVYKH